MALVISAGDGAVRWWEARNIANRHCPLSTCVYPLVHCLDRLTTAASLSCSCSGSGVGNAAAMFCKYVYIYWYIEMHVHVFFVHIFTHL